MYTIDVSYAEFVSGWPGSVTNRLGETRFERKRREVRLGKDPDFYGSFLRLYYGSMGVDPSP